MRNAITCLAIGMLCSTYAYAALPVIQKDLDKSQTPTTLADAQIAKNDSHEPMASTEPQVRDVVYSASNLTDAQKINEMSKMLNFPIYGQPMDDERMAVAREALEIAFPYIGGLKSLSVYPVSMVNSGSGGYGDVTVGIDLMGATVGEDYRYFMETSDANFSFWPMSVSGPTDVDNTLCIIFHEFGHANSVGNDQFPRYLFSQYPNCRVSASAGKDEDECIAEFTALMFVYPEEMARFCAYYPDVNVVYTGVKKFYADRGVPVPTKDLFPRRDK